MTNSDMIKFADLMEEWARTKLQSSSPLKYGYLRACKDMRMLLENDK